MYKELNHKIYMWISSTPPWTNVYGLARSIMALTTSLTLMFNDASIFFKASSATEEYPNCFNNLSIFCFVPNDYYYLNLVKWIAVILLLVVASGWRPRFTGVIHWWIAYSINVSALSIDGGEQVASVLTLLMIPITLTDSRKWHWQKFKLRNKEKSIRYLYSSSIAWVFSTLIRIQIAIIYFNSTVAKFKSEDWLNGTAVYYYVQDPMLGLPPILLSIVKPIIESNWIVVPTWGTLVVQLFLFLFLFAPKRYWKYMFIFAVLFHEVIAIMLGLISFSLVMFSALILYLRPIEKHINFSMLSKNIPKNNKDLRCLKEQYK